MANHDALILRVVFDYVEKNLRNCEKIISFNGRSRKPFETLSRVKQNIMVDNG